jgi:hypothetical protein
MLDAFVDGVGLLGPGFSSWAEGRAQLDGSVPYTPARTELPAPMALPAAERRRAGMVVKVSLAVACEAVAASGVDAMKLPSVFTSSSGDAINCHQICSALASNDRLISPTRFHNSVHNASSGYWSISSGAMASSSVLCGHDGSFSAGLLEAMTQVAVDQVSVLLVAYDTTYPEPLFSKRPLPDTFGIAIVLSPIQGARSQARWSLDPRNCFTQTPADQMSDAALEQLRSSIPAARCLPLIEATGSGRKGLVILDYLQHLQLSLYAAPCH